MRNIKLIIEYDGTRFSGWQWQPKDRTVQDELQKSILKILKEQVNLIGSGRTDAGVHAMGQVANFHTETSMTAFKMKAALNGTLPKDVRVLSVEDVPDSFHSRFDAKEREYHYSIARREKAIGRDYCYLFRKKIDVDRMRRASEHLIGTHDFQSFCQSNSEVDHYLCSVKSIRIVETDDLLRLEIISNRYLHNMVRIITGTLLQAGTGKIEPAQIIKILEAKDRRAAGLTVPAIGLCLVRVEYQAA